MQWPSISVVIPSLNMGAFLERALLSIQRQDYPGRIQTIVADGGSSDQTVEVLRRFPQVKWWSAPDGGMADAMIRGLTAAEGDILAVQACDDFYLQDAFRRCIGELNADPALDIAAGCDIYLQPDGKTFSCSRLDSHDITPRSLLMRRVIPIHAAFFRRRVWDKVKVRSFNAARSDKGGNVGNVGVDIDFWYRALHLCKGRFVPHHVAAYQFHPDQMTGNSRHWHRNMTAIVESCEKDPLYAGLHRFSAVEKKNLYVRWEVQQARFDGNEADVVKRVEQIMTDADYTNQTRDFLALHGFAPKAPKAAAPSHPNHRLPDFNWMFTQKEAAAA